MWRIRGGFASWQPISDFVTRSGRRIIVTTARRLGASLGDDLGTHLHARPADVGASLPAGTTNSLLDDIRSAMTLRTWAIERSPQYTARHEESCWQMMRQRFNTTV
jgi:hypothetical protein